MARTEIRFAGFGGQGVVLAGVLLGEAAVIHDGKYAIQTQTYGAAARGGAARSDVIISEDRIIYPQVTAPDIMVAFTLEAMNKYKSEMKEGALLIVDSSLFTPPDGLPFRVYRCPATGIAMNELGKGIVANMVMLGFLTALTGIVSEDAMTEAIRANVPKGTEELNLKAFRRGMELGKEAK
ncbi:MAG: 2-oxoacid:acceptor oxidoreductase family protein [Candidatus Latescibacter sp.]|nr:2-oxoacid:acceptor oxidoreductase family protein [Candidatus Latescibacter sp.]